MIRRFRALVGERGPEVIRMRPNERVWTAEEVKAMHEELMKLKRKNGGPLGLS